MISPDAPNTILFAYRAGGFQKFVAALLTGSGYSLITAIDGADALHKADAFNGAIHLLLAGVELPGMTGPELAIQFKRKRPDTKVLLISGLDCGILTLNEDWQFLPKPLMESLLKGKIRDLLSEKGPPDADAPVSYDASQVLSEGPSSIKTILYAKGKVLRQSVAASLQDAEWQLMVAGSGAEALQKASEFTATIHLLVANLDLADMTGIELAERLNEERPDTKVLLVATMASGTLILDHGWHFLPAPFETGMLRHKILELLELLEQTNKCILKNSLAKYHSTRSEKLTNREVQILKLIARGNSTKQAAAGLGIAFKTASGHRSSLMKKLGIHDTAGLVRYAIRAGLIHS
jgi:DNA-binding NarL/FixJ family response regulator